MEALQIYINWYKNKLITTMARYQKAKSLPEAELKEKYLRAYENLKDELFYFANMYLKLIVYEGFYCDSGWDKEQYARYGEIESSPAFKSCAEPLMSSGMTSLMECNFVEVHSALMALRSEVALIVKRLGGYEGEKETAIISAAVTV